MKTTITAIASAILTLALIAPNAQADVLNFQEGDRYIGSILTGSPPESEQVQYVNYLLGRAPGSGDFTNPDDGQTYNREGSTLDTTLLDLAVLDGHLKYDVPPTDFVGGRFALDTTITTPLSVTGYTYLLAKYDGPNSYAFVWHVAGLSSASIPELGPNKRDPNHPGHQLSHTILFNPYTPTPPAFVPDGGMTLMLLGSAVFGLEALRRRFGS